MENKPAPYKQGDYTTLQFNMLPPWARHEILLLEEMVKHYKLNAEKAVTRLKRIQSEIDGIRAGEY